MTFAATPTKYHDSVRLEYICSYWAAVTTPEVIGPLTDCTRMQVYVTSGEVIGPRMRGRLRPVGGHWFTLRSDGIAVLDVRTTFEMEDGALIYTNYSGIADLGDEGYTQFMAGTPPARVPLRITPQYRTGHPEYRWLNRLQCIGVGEVDMEQLRATYDVYAMS
jgi:hypothetical protein